MPLKSWKDLIADSGGAGGNFEPIPDGDYDFVVLEAETKQSGNGKTMYVTKNQVESGPHVKRLVWHQHVVSPESPNALAWFFRNMKVLGLGDTFFDNDPSDHQVAQALVGKRFRGQVKTRQWQGQDKNEIGQFFTARSSVGGPVAPAGNAPAPAPSAAPAPSGPPPAPAPAPAPAYAAPAAAQEAAPPPPAPAATPPPPPVQQSVPAPPPPAAEPPAAPPLPTVAEAATPPGVPTPPEDAPF